MKPAEQVVYLDRIRGLIDEYGWAVQGVFPTPEQDPHSGFCYTAGLHARGLPELWVASMPAGQGARLLNEIAGSLVRRREGLTPFEPPADGLVLDVAWTVPFRLRGPVDYETAEAFTAGAVAGDAVVPVFQVLWPDPAGTYADEVGYDAAGFPQRLLPYDLDHGGDDG